MDTFELNKIAGAFLGTLLFAMWLNVISSAIFTPAKLVKPGYPLPAAQETAAAGNGAPAPAITPIENRLAKADVKKGEVDTKPCQACHNFDKGGVTKIGPPLYDVVDRPKATVNGFSYSDAIKSRGGKWTYADLDQFLADPKGYAPGTKMTFAGEADPIKRADIIDYLHILSDSPEPLPASGQPDQSMGPARSQLFHNRRSTPCQTFPSRFQRAAQPRRQVAPARSLLFHNQRSAPFQFVLSRFPRTAQPGLARRASTEPILPQRKQTTAETRAAHQPSSILACQNALVRRVLQKPGSYPAFSCLLWEPSNLELILR